MAVVAAGELHHEVATGEAAREPDRGHGGLGARGDQAHLLDRRTFHDRLGQLDLAPRRGAVRRAPADRIVDSGLDLGVGVAEQQWTPRADQVDVLVAVHVTQPRASSGGHEPRGPADRVERPDRGVHASRGHPVGTPEPVGGGVAETGRGGADGLGHSGILPDHPKPGPTARHPVAARVAEMLINPFIFARPRHSLDAGHTLGSRAWRPLCRESHTRFMRDSRGEESLMDVPGGNGDHLASCWTQGREPTR